MDILKYQEMLATNWEYRKLPSRKSREVRKIFNETMPKVNCDLPIYSKSGTLLARGFKRVVIGDYGAFLEIEMEQIMNQRCFIYHHTK